MKATLDIPDDLYRSVKARSALEGRPLRAVAIELFQNWLSGSVSSATNSSPRVPDAPTSEELARYPWLSISQKYVKPGVPSGMSEIRESIARGWAADGAKKLAASPAKS